MNNRWVRAFLSSSLSIVPMIAIVLVLSFTKLAPLNAKRGDYFLLLIGMVVLVVGLAIFQIGASSSLSKVGEYMGSSLSKQKNLFIVILFSFALGALITVAEPSILIVSKQVNINGFLLIGGIALGVGLFVVIGVIRIIFHRSLKLWYLFFYFLTFMIMLLVTMNPEKKIFLPFIFDSGGVTTGSATVPFILSLGAGIAMVRGGKNARNDSFGLVGMASIGPILTVAIILFCANISGDFDPTTTYTQLGTVPMWKMFLDVLLPTSAASRGTMIDVLIAIAPTMVIFLIYNAIFIKLPKAKIKKLLVGFLFTYFGLTVFLTGTSFAMTPIGYYVGSQLGLHSNWIIIMIAFIIGLVTILCEPAVHVLTQQMEDISDGRTNKFTVLLTLSLGVGIAIALAVIRTIFNFSIMYYMVPGYIISIALMFVCPDIFTAMAFDSGGTASGPMASSFVLPMVVGITVALSKVNGTNPNYYEQSFGVIALIALTPVIAIQILGVIYNVKTVRARIKMRTHVYTADDAQIIHFN
ncbi:MAG: DUF1538 domain-containing protein [Bacilli bacterium]|nr:DUF1538 domain-containing protein [Bacilli bacterium]